MAGLNNGNGSGARRAHLLRLSARNIKSLRAIEIDRFGAITEIRGDAGQGKTSILEAIEGGLRGLDPSMVRQGEDSAEIVLELDVARIQRIVRAGGGRDVLAVSANGQPIEKAKEFLRALLPDSACFRPLEFVQLGGGDEKGRTERLRQQRNMLLDAMPVRLDPSEVGRSVQDLGDDVFQQAAGVDIDDIDFEQHALSVCAALEKRFYESRKAINQEADKAEARLSAYPAPAKAAPPQGVAECKEALEVAQRSLYQAEAHAQSRAATLRRRDELRAKVGALDGLPPLEQLHQVAQEAGREVTRLEETAKGLQEEMQELQRKLAKVHAEREDARFRRDQAQDRLALRNRLQDAQLELRQIEAGLGDEASADTVALREEVQRRQELLQRREQQDRHEEALKVAMVARARAGAFDKLVALFRDDLPREIVGRMAMPVPGLAVEEGVVTLRGVPLHQLGTSEQLRTAIQLAAALNPSTGFVLVDRAESLGTADRAALASIAEELDLQLVLTFVDALATPAEGVVVMRNGERVG
jgi:DNA repair exonuclease SbcCD ATPase subunit